MRRWGGFYNKHFPHCTSCGMFTKSLVLNWANKNTLKKYYWLDYFSVYSKSLQHAALHWLPFVDLKKKKKKHPNNMGTFLGHLNGLFYMFKKAFGAKKKGKTKSTLNIYTENVGSIYNKLYVATLLSPWRWNKKTWSIYSISILLTLHVTYLLWPPSLSR